MSRNSLAEGLRGCFFVGVLIFLVLLIVVLGGGFGYRMLAAGRAMAKLDAIRKSGEPVTAEELAVQVRQNVATDANSAWIQAVTSFGTSQQPEDEQRLPILGQGQGPPASREDPWTAEELTRQRVADMRPQLDEIHRVAKAGGTANYVDAYTLPDLFSSDVVQKTRTAARWLALEALVRARDGDRDGVYESIQSLLSLSESLRYEATLLSQLIHIALFEMAANTLSETLCLISLNDEQLSSIQVSLRRIDFPAALEQALIGERVCGIANMKNMPSLVTRDDDLGFYLDTMGRMIVASKQPWPAARMEGMRLDSEASAQLQKAIMKLRYALVLQVLPACRAAGDAVGRAMTRQRAADVALAIERYKLEHGERPPTLKALVPKFLSAVPSDPFDGRPLRYGVAGEGYVVYGVGKDEQDDGGKVVPEHKRPLDDLFSVGVPRPENGDNGSGQ